MAEEEVISAHGWAECRPLVLPVLGASDQAGATVKQLKMDRIWASLSDIERAMFHQYTCLDRRSAQHCKIMDKVAERLLEQD